MSKSDQQSATAQHTILIAVKPDLEIDYGTIINQESARTMIQAPRKTAFEQLVDYLSILSRPHKRKAKPKELGEGLTALCIRWGSYFGYADRFGQPITSRSH